MWKTIISVFAFKWVMNTFPGYRPYIYIGLIILGISATLGIVIELRKHRKRKQLLIESKGYRGNQGRHNPNSNKYHYPTCKWAQSISPKNLVIFDSAKEAQAAGYVPCKVCKPPLAD